LGKLYFFILSLDLVDLEYLSLDSTSIKVHEQATRYPSYHLQGIGRSAGGLTTKVHCIVDSFGHPLGFRISPGQHHDIRYAKDLIKPLSYQGDYLIADKAYASKDLRQFIRLKGMTSVIPSKNNSLKKQEIDKLIYKERNIVERVFRALKEYRRFFTRYDKLLLHFTGTVYLSAIGAIFI
jgi:transposase